MDLKTAKAKLEALVFASAEPLSLEDLSRALDLDKPTVGALLQEIRDDCRRPERGVDLFEVAGGYQFRTKPEFADVIEKVSEICVPGGLSQAALETLSVIAYKQPVTKAEIEEIRGVRCGSALDSLFDRGLIDEVGRKDSPGRPILYGTTRLFLREFGLNGLFELPPLDYE